MLDIKKLQEFIIEKVATYLTSLPSQNLKVSEMPAHLALIVQKNDDIFTLGSIDLLDIDPSEWKKHAENQKHRSPDCFGYVLWAIAKLGSAQSDSNNNTEIDAAVIIINFISNNYFFLLDIERLRVSEVENPVWLPGYFDAEEISH